MEGFCLPPAFSILRASTREEESVFGNRGLRRVDQPQGFPLVELLPELPPGRRRRLNLHELSILGGGQLKTPSLGLNPSQDVISHRVRIGLTAALNPGRGGGGFT